MKKKQRFEIDFFEFSFLVESCIPPSPIARAYFWGNVIDKYYHEMTENEREMLFVWINRNPRFQSRLKDNEDCQLFNARFDPNNQYLIKTLFKGKEETFHIFKWKDSYHTSKTTSIQPEFITKIDKICEI